MAGVDTAIKTRTLFNGVHRLRCADQAMYRARQGGRGGVRFFAV